MRFYTQQRDFYCGIDLHARSMYLCILDRDGKIVLHRNMACSPQAFLEAIAPFRDKLVVGVECIFCWYWLADLCAAEQIDFVLGHPTIRNRASETISMRMALGPNVAVQPEPVFGRSAATACWASPARSLFFFCNASTCDGSLLKWTRTSWST
jgi:hypothetical protein